MSQARCSQQTSPGKLKSPLPRSARPTPLQESRRASAAAEHAWGSGRSQCRSGDGPVNAAESESSTRTGAAYNYVEARFYSTTTTFFDPAKEALRTSA